MGILAYRSHRLRILFLSVEHHWFLTLAADRWCSFTQQTVTAALRDRPDLGGGDTPRNKTGGKISALPGLTFYYVK